MDAVTENPLKRLRYSVSLVRQGNHSFYTLTMPSDVLARTCVVSTRKEGDGSLTIAKPRKS